MKLRFTPRAIANIEEIADYIGRPQSDRGPPGSGQRMSLV